MLLNETSERSTLQEQLDAQLKRTIERIEELSMEEEAEREVFRMKGLWGEIPGANHEPIRVEPDLWRRAC